MTAHVHDSSTRRTDDADGAAPAVRANGSNRPRWLLPAVAGGLVVAVLVAYGVLSPSAVLYGGMFGGMLLMHLGGHGSHGSHGSHDGQGRGTTTGTGDMSRPTSGAAADQTTSGGVPDYAPVDGPSRSESEGDAARGSHGCH